MGIATGGSNLNVSKLQNVGINEAHGAGFGGPAVQAAGRDQANVIPTDPLSFGASFNEAFQQQGNVNLTGQEAGSGEVSGSDNVTAINVA